MTYKIGKIYITLTKLIECLENPPKEEQLIAIALYENYVCTNYLIHQEYLDLIFENSKVAFNQIPEAIKCGLLGTNETFYNYLQSSPNDMFRFSNLEILLEKSPQNILNEFNSPLISN